MTEVSPKAAYDGPAASGDAPQEARLPPVPSVGRAAGDHVLALHALNVLRAELGGMTYNTIDGVHSNLWVCAQSLDMVESLIKHHAEMRYRGVDGQR